MACEEFETLILEYFENALSKEGRCSVDKHLAECEGCRRFWARQECLDESLKASLPAPLPSNALRRRILHRTALEACRQKPSYWPELLDLLGSVAVAAAGGVLLNHLLGLPAVKELSPELGVFTAWSAAAVCLLVAFWLTLTKPTPWPDQG